MHYSFVITTLWIGGVLSFAPSTSRNAVFGTHKARQLNLWWGNKEEPIRPIDLQESKGATDVVASRMNSPVDDGVIDTSVSAVPLEPFAEETDYNVIIVGAGCAGIGEALMLTRTFGMDPSKVICLDKGAEVGDTFRKWPEEMRFISPSFNQQGWTNSFDLNAIHYDTSPAAMLRTEHPSGEEYALYLEQIVQQANINVQLQTKVTSITDVGKKGNRGPGPFNIAIEHTDKDGKTTEKTLSTRYVVWAAGEFQFPREKRTVTYTPEGPVVADDSIFPGADLCVHNSRVKSWAGLPGDEFVIIGGYESGIDAAVNLAKAGKKTKVLASTPCWTIQTFDPSTELAPYTSARLREVLSHSFSGPKPELLAPIEVIAVDKASDGSGYNIAAKWKAIDESTPPNNREGLGFEVGLSGKADSILVLETKQPPVLCTGFEGSVKAEASDLFAFPSIEEEKKGCIGNGPLLTLNDESTKVPGVFLVGPSVTHGELSFCFVYKFRQRFGVVANAICEGLGMDTKQSVFECRQTNMYLDNFAVCEGLCDC